MKPIETTFNGIRYRSRTEARWAAFFSALGATAIYEPEGYKLSCGLYLPDFYIPDYDLFFEVKADAPTEEERRKCERLADESGKRVAMSQRGPTGGYGDLIYLSGGKWIPGGTFGSCRRCGGIGLCYCFNSDEYEHFGFCFLEKEDCGDRCGEKYTISHGKTAQAVTFAKNHRFGVHDSMER